MKALSRLKSHLRQGRVYRRQELSQWSTSIDRHLDELLKDGTLKKLSQGLYYYPKASVFGEVPPKEDELVKAFLNDDRFLITSPNAYNTLGLGTTQLYNNRIVYNRKRHGVFSFGNRTFHFVIRPDFPSKVNEEFLLVDMVNNRELLAEDLQELQPRIETKLFGFDRAAIKKAITRFGNSGTKKFFLKLLKNHSSENGSDIPASA